MVEPAAPGVNRRLGIDFSPQRGKDAEKPNSLRRVGGRIWLRCGGSADTGAFVGTKPIGGVSGWVGMEDDGSEIGVSGAGIGSMDCAAAACRSWRALRVRRYMRLVASIRR